MMDIEKKYAECGPYKIIKKVGKGAFGKVKLAVRDEIYYAIKMFSVQGCQQKNLKSFTNEVKMLEQVNHPNMVRMISYGTMSYVKKNGQSEERICIVLEYAPGGELFEFLQQTGSFSEEVCRFYFKQLLSALQYLHGQGLAHRDIKPENILFDANFNLKLTDFGFSTFVGKNGTGSLETKLGTQAYMAPEIIAGQSYNGSSVDLFASGIILFIMLSGCPPFKYASPNDQWYRCICTNRYDEFWGQFCKRLNNIKFFSSDFKSLVSAMLAFDPTQRLSMSEILAQPWLQGPVATIEQIREQFVLRKIRVDAQLVKEKLKYQANKQAQQTPQVQTAKQSPLFCGFGNFRSMMQQYREFDTVNNTYNLNAKDRTLRELDVELRKVGDYYTHLDPDYLLRFLLTGWATFCNEILKVYDDRYKVLIVNHNHQFKIRCLKDSEKVTLSIQFYKVNAELIFVDFIKEEGSTLEFYQIVNEIQDIINQDVNRVVVQE